MRQGANEDDIISAGETTLVCLYNGNPYHVINVFRHEKFCMQPGALPTSGSVKYHRLSRGSLDSLAEVWPATAFDWSVDLTPARLFSDLKIEKTSVTLVLVCHQIQEWLSVKMSSVNWG